MSLRNHLRCQRLNFLGQFSKSAHGQKGTVSFNVLMGCTLAVFLGWVSQHIFCTQKWMHIQRSSLPSIQVSSVIHGLSHSHLRVTIIGTAEKTLPNSARIDITSARCTSYCKPIQTSGGSREITQSVPRAI